MSLIPCRECGRIVSDQAEICPQCGIPTPDCRIHAARSRPLGWIVHLLLSPLYGALGCYGGCFLYFLVALLIAIIAATL